MAKILTSDQAPSEDVTYTFPSGSFEVASGGSYETDEYALAREAAVHPWLDVEYDEGENPQPAFRPGTVPPEDDALSAENSIAFDPEEVAKEREEALGDQPEARVAEPASPTEEPEETVSPNYGEGDTE